MHHETNDGYREYHHNPQEEKIIHTGEPFNDWQKRQMELLGTMGETQMKSLANLPELENKKLLEKEIREDLTCKSSFVKTGLYEVLQVLMLDGIPCTQLMFPEEIKRMCGQGSGRTTRLADAFIQKIFMNPGHAIAIKDHTDDHENDLLLYSIVRGRLYREHPSAQCVCDKLKLTITLIA